MSSRDLRVELLGRFRVWVDRRSVGGGGWRLRKAANLVKLLALAPGHSLHREQVMDRLWSDMNPQAAANNLRQAVYVARRILEPAKTSAEPRHLVVHDGWIALFPGERLWVDVEAFEEAAASARGSGGEPAAYRAAVDLYAGDLLPQDRYEAWAETRREELRHSYLSLLSELAGIYEERGNPEAAIEALCRVLEADPRYEEAHLRLIRLYAGGGRRREALLQYERLRRVLWDELGVEPGETGRRLYEEVLLGRAPTAPESPVERGEAESGLPERDRRNNLPAERTSFVGRADQVVEVERLMAMTRLLTLTGVGGAGKTRLALEIARNLVEIHPEGAWLVELAALSDPEPVPQAVAKALGVREQPGLPLTAALKDHLHSKKLLLVIDNCEHLVDATARLVETLLDACPELRVLTTSREALNVPGEMVWRVPSLSVPGRGAAVEGAAGSESVRLFVERARYRDPDFVLTPENAAAVAGVCRGLGGIPLAIELAAAQVGALSIGQISARLAGSLELLEGSRTAPLRQRTLEGALDWSYRLLTEKEKRLFGWLSVFAGGWTLEAAEEVGAGRGIEPEDVLRLLLGLVDKSLVTVEPAGDGEPRYGMLQPVRQYAAHKLKADGGAEGVHRRHVAWFLGLAEKAASEIEGPRQLAWLERLEAEHDDLRATLTWLREKGDAEKGLRLAAALGRYWYLRGYFAEGKVWLEEFLDLSARRDATMARAKAFYELGALANRNADPSDDRAAARGYLRESLRIYRQLGDGPQTTVLRELGSVSIGVSDWRTARAALEEALDLDERAGDDGGIAKTHTFLGIMTCLQGDLEPAQAHFEESLAYLEGTGAKNDVNTNLYFLGCLACDRGEYAAARAYFGRMMEGNSLHLFRWAAPVVMLGYARLAAGEGQAARALRLAGAGTTLRRAIGGPTGPAFIAYLRRGLEPAWRTLGREEAMAAFEQGSAMTLEEAVECAFGTEDPAPSDPGGSPVGPSPAALTPREREVAILVARELTNRQIAVKLFISERTAATHVHKILSKLGLRSRTQISSWTVEQQPRP